VSEKTKKSGLIDEHVKPLNPFPHVVPCFGCGSVEIEFRDEVYELIALGSLPRRMGRTGRTFAMCPRCGIMFDAAPTSTEAQGIRNRECAEKRGHGMMCIIDPGDKG
jgi:hypothetical protein